MSNIQAVLAKGRGVAPAAMFPPLSGCSAAGMRAVGVAMRTMTGKPTRPWLHIQGTPAHLASPGTPVRPFVSNRNGVKASIILRLL